MEKKKVVFIIEEFNSSGGIKIVTAIANALVDAGLQVGFIIPRYTGKPYYPLNEGIELSYLGTKKLGNKIQYFLLLILKIRTLHCTIVTPNYRIAALCGRFATISPEQLVFLIQGDDSVSLIKHSSSKPIVKWVNNLVLKRSKDVQANRIFVSIFLLEHSIKKGQLIANYIADCFLDSPKRLLFSDESITIGTVSTSAPNKGFDLFLKCIDELNSIKPTEKEQFRFRCATQDSTLISSNDRHNIDFVSPNNEQEMSAFYQSCDIYLSCSISEGFNLPVLEAMATGCIVLATNDGGVTDFIEDGKDGYLLENRDAKNISQRLDALMLDKALLQKIQSNAIQKAKKYSRAEFNNAYLRFFNS